MSHVLAVGIATLDIINTVDHYPVEDSEVRAGVRTVRRGGNATNTLVLLSQLGHRCDWAGVMVETPDTRVISDELASYSISTRYCSTVSSGTMPTSCITLSRATGSRTIVHYRDLDEYGYDSFSGIPLDHFDWVHFEGRNVSEVGRMMRKVRSLADRPCISLELEKPRKDIESLLPLADLCLFSSAFARQKNLGELDLLRSAQHQAPAAVLVCTRAALGAVGLTPQGEVIESRASALAQVVDTIGAGDTFNAGIIDRLLAGEDLESAMRFANELAGNKCARYGLHGVPLPGGK